MIFDRESNSLKTSKDQLIKKFDCPLSKEWKSMSTTASAYVRFCSSCRKDVVDITPFNEKQIIALFKVNTTACAHINFNEALCEIELKGTASFKECCNFNNHSSLPVINTARDIDAINRAVSEGYTVVIEPTKPNDAPESKVCLIQIENGLYKIEGYDLRSPVWMDSQTTYLKSGGNDSPFSAYIIPRNFPANTKVFITDIIEHRISSSWNQGDKYRLNSGEALWDGERIIIDDVTCSEFLG
jgi:hypothetical protein